MTFIQREMMKEAVRVINSNGVNLQAEFIEGNDRLVLHLTDAPYTELTLVGSAELEKARLAGERSAYEFPRGEGS